MRKITLLFFIFCASLAISTAQVSMNTHFIGRWTDFGVPVNFIGQRFNDVWGYSQNGREYGIIGSTIGVHFIDITDTANIVEADRVTGFIGDAIHRDFKNYGHYLYAISDEDPVGVQVIDMQYLPDSVHLVRDTMDILRTAHNMYIDTSMQKLYLFGPRDTNGGNVQAMFIYSVANPEQPEYIATFHHPTFWYVHDGYIRNDTAQLNCGFEGFYYGDFSDPFNPAEIGTLEFYPDQGYNHSGWLTPDSKYYVMSDETHGMRMKIIDMQPGPNLLSFHGLMGSGVSPYSIPHNQLIKGNYVYVSYYHDGLRIFDISDVDNPTIAGYYDTYPGNADTTDYAGAWGTYPLLPSGKILISDMQGGLYIVGADLATVSVPPAPPAPQLSLYPNPSRDLVRIKNGEEGTKYSVSILDASGKTVKSISVTGDQPFSIVDLPAGTYQVVLHSAHTSCTLRLVRP